MIKAFCFFFLFLMDVYFLRVPLWAQITNLVPLTIDQTDVPIRVDGHLNDWPSARMFLLNRKDQLTYGKAYWKGPEDFSGRVFITYDQQYLYFSFIVQKAGRKAVNGYDKLSLTNGDGLEFFLSTRSDLDQQNRLRRGDYHIVFSPGNDCKNPQMYCLNKDCPIPGGRINARGTLKGYLVEACVPLIFFKGLDLGEGKTAGFNLVLNEGGEVSGNRIVQLNYGGEASDTENPSTWFRFQWIGKIDQAVPMESLSDLNAELVADGTKRTTFRGYRKIQGTVLDSQGKPLAGSKVSSWPKSQETMTDTQGHFEFEKLKTFSPMVFYATKEGFISSLSAIPPKRKPLIITLAPVPPEIAPASNQVGPYFVGLCLSPGPLEAFQHTLEVLQEWIKPLKPGLIRLKAPDFLLTSQNNPQVLDQFYDFVHQMGAEAMLTIPLDPQNLEIGADWVRYCNVQKKYGIRYWSIGEEPDWGNALEPGQYNAYDYINHYREIYNAMKKEDPSIIIFGPELFSKYTEGESDWITPFLIYDWDIVNGISIHQYACAQSVSLTFPELLKDLRHEGEVFRSVKDKISENSDLNIPLGVTTVKACAEAVTAKTKNEAQDLEFWSALWEADRTGIDLREGLRINLSSSIGLDSNGGSSFSFQPHPAYWAIKLWSLMIRGKIITAVVQKGDISVYATQEPQSKDVTLMLINKGDRYWRPNILLNGKATDLMVDAGLDQRYDFEIPSFSICLLKMRSDRSPGEAIVYTLKMSRLGKEPQQSQLKPW